MRFLLESDIKEVYHLTNIQNLENILNTNKLGKYSWSSVSLTKNKNLTTYIGAPPRAIFRLVLDCNTLSKDYKLKDYLFHDINDNHDFSYEEELVTEKQIENISKYLIRIDIIPDSIENEKEYLDLNTDDNKLYLHGGYKKYTWKDLRNFIQNLINKYNVKVFYHGHLTNNYNILKNLDIL